MDIYFYTKEGCPLCDIAEKVLDSLSNTFNMHIHRIDINSDIDAYEKYWDMIPVIELPNGNILWGNIEKKDFEDAVLSKS